MLARYSVYRWLCVLAVAVLPAACTSTVDVKQALELAEPSGGWYDAGIVDGKNRIVPTVSFRVRKKADADIDAIALNVVFRHPPAPGATTEDDWGEVFVQTARFSDNNETETPLLTVRTNDQGYTGEPPQSRMDLFQNSHFRDVRARVFVRQGSTQWVEVGLIELPRQLITR